MKILHIVIPLITFLAACSEAPTPPPNGESQPPVEKKTPLADRVKKDLQDNILLQEHGLKLIVVDESNGFVKLNLVEGPKNLREGISEGLDLESGDGATWELLNRDESAVKAFNSLRSVITYVKGIDGVKAVSLTAEINTVADRADELFQKGDRYYQSKQYSLAVVEFEKAADQGNANAQSNLGYMYESGKGVAKDEREAVRWYRLSADQGNATAQSNLGYMYESGKGVAKDEREAVRWYRLAADQGDASAQYNLGVMYEYGKGVTKDEKEAVRWYRLSADQGNANAQRNLGHMYRLGRGVAKDEREAVRWYRLAADQGDASAQYNLGVMYEYGKGVTKDEKEAVRWYRLSADQGNANAQRNLGHMYRLGRGVAKDERETVRWYRLSADQGNATAQSNLGVMCRLGKGVAKDEREAVRWFRLSADQGNATAQNNLGVMYRLGKGVAKDEREAVRWHRLSADQGNTAAQNNLGWIYATCPDSRIRDGKKAVEYAQRAYSKEPKVWENVGTLAAAYARTGNFGEAVKMQKEAIRLLEGEKSKGPDDDPMKWLKEAKERLALYSKNKPYTQTEETNSPGQASEERNKLGRPTKMPTEDIVPESLADSKLQQKYTFSASVGRQKISIGEETSLRLLFEITDTRVTVFPKDFLFPKLTEISGIKIIFTNAGTQSGIRVEDAKLIHKNSRLESYEIVGAKAGRFEIPSVAVSFKGVEYHSEPLTIEVTAEKPKSPLGAGQSHFMTLKSDKSEVFVNELIAIELKLYARGHDSFYEVLETPAFDQSGDFLVNPFPQTIQRSKIEIEGIPHSVVSLSTSVSALKPGTLHLGLVPLRVRITDQNPSHSRGKFFSSAVPLTLKVDDLNLTVLPLPLEGQLQSFSGSVGQFKLDVSARPLNPSAGEPVHIEMKVTGSGTFHSGILPHLLEASSWKLYPGLGKVLGDVIGDQIEVDHEQMGLPPDGDPKIPSLQLVYFDPEKEKYIITKSRQVPLTVTSQPKKNQSIVLISPQKEEADETPLPVLQLASHESASHLLQTLGKALIGILIFGLFLVFGWTLLLLLRRGHLPSD